MWVNKNMKVEVPIEHFTSVTVIVNCNNLTCTPHGPWVHTLSACMLCVLVHFQFRALCQQSSAGSPTFHWNVTVQRGMLLNISELTLDKPTNVITFVPGLFFFFLLTHYSNMNKNDVSIKGPTRPFNAIKLRFNLARSRFLQRSISNCSHR